MGRRWVSRNSCQCFRNARQWKSCSSSNCKSLSHLILHHLSICHSCQVTLSSSFQVPEIARPASSRSQDDAMVSYIFQRPQPDSNFQGFSKHHSRWLGDESIAEVIFLFIHVISSIDSLMIPFFDFQVKQGHTNDVQPAAPPPSSVNSQQRSQFEQVTTWQ